MSTLSTGTILKRVTIELEDGQIIDLAASSVEVNVKSSFLEVESVQCVNFINGEPEIELVIKHAANMSISYDDNEDYKEAIEESRGETEYKCLSCNTPNPLEKRYCSQCGAPRHFLI